MEITRREFIQFGRDQPHGIRGSVHRSSEGLQSENQRVHHDHVKTAGAVIIGKAGLQEFAMGGSSVSTYFRPVRNPWDLDRIAAGSSGGSAAAVISDMTIGALGTDTGGSVRMPAAFMERSKRFTGSGTSERQTAIAESASNY